MLSVKNTLINQSFRQFKSLLFNYIEVSKLNFETIFYSTLIVII